jgi:hypothetical protein
MEERASNGPRKLTQSDMVLIALFRASKGTTNKVAYEELVLQAWRDFPEQFSLRNYPKYPDGSDIHKKLYNGPLKTESLVLSLGDKHFRLTAKGLEEAKKVVEALDNVSPRRLDDNSRLSRDAEKFIKHGLQSRALTDWQAGKSEKLVDYDARMFFQFSTGTTIEERKRKAKDAKEAIEKAILIGVEGAKDLKAVANFLTEKFEQLFKEG